MTDNPTHRALTVFGAVAAHGPVSLKHLTGHLPEISRMGIWRALNNLRDAGWLRMRMGDNAWVVTHRPDDILANTHIPPRAVEELVAKLQDLPKATAVHIGTFTDIGRFEIVESTDHEQIGNILPLISDPMAFSALAISEDADMLRHLKRYMENTSDAVERDLITSGGIIKGLRAIKEPADRTIGGVRIKQHRADDQSVAVASFEGK